MENKRYLDKVIKHLVNRTKIDYEKKLLFFPFSSQSLPFSLTPYSILPHPYPPNHFIDYCENIYGLTIIERKYVWKEYREIILEKINQ